MIYYTPNPLDLLDNQENTNRREYMLPSGGVLTTEVLADNRIRVISLISTDPADYMNSDFAPGRVMEPSITIK